MTKIEELIESIIKCEEFTMGYDDVCWPDDVKRIMTEYAEQYAKQVLELAARNAKLSVGNWVHPRGYPCLMVNQNPNRMEGEDYFYVDQKSITDIKLPLHE